MRRFTTSERVLKALLLIWAMAAASSGPVAQAHSCEMFLPTEHGFRLVTVNGAIASLNAHAFGGDMSIGMDGDRLAVVGMVPATPRHPPRLMFTLWDTRTERVLLQKYSGPVRFAPPTPMMGFLNGLAVVGHAAYFQAWEAKQPGNPATIRVKNSLARVDLGTGAVTRAARLPVPAGSAPLFHALAVPKGLVLFCGCGGRTVWLYTPGKRRLSARFAAVVPKRGLLVFVKHYGLVTWRQDGRIQRVSRADMAKAKFPAFAMPRGVVDVHPVYSGKDPRLACMAWRDTAGHPGRGRSQATLFIYDLRRHAVLWQKKFGPPIGARIYGSFRPSANGEVFACLVDTKPLEVMFYDHRTGKITNVKLPPQCYSLAGAQMISVR